MELTNSHRLLMRLAQGLSSPSSLRRCQRMSPLCCFRFMIQIIHLIIRIIRVYCDSDVVPCRYFCLDDAPTYHLEAVDKYPSRFSQVVVRLAELAAELLPGLSSTISRNITKRFKECNKYHFLLVCRWAYGCWRAVSGSRLWRSRYRYRGKWLKHRHVNTQHGAESY